LHLFDGGSELPYGIVWWDPRALTLDQRPTFGIRRQELIEDAGPEVVETERRRYLEWQASREAALEQGMRPSLVVRTVTDWARSPDGDADGAEPEVTVVDASSGLARPSGPRFGSLVHAILAIIALDAEEDAIMQVASLQSRILDAAPDETAAAVTLVKEALGHPLIAQAREAWRGNRCRRETPLATVEPDGSILEGVLDLAFEDDSGWTVVDFKTEAELTKALTRYRRQVAKYAAVVAQVSGRPARAVLMRL
jgi:ATP-dependent exoDNAse (exonuclease V) beta subunit